MDQTADIRIEETIDETDYEINKASDALKIHEVDNIISMLVYLLIIVFLFYVFYLFFLYV